MAYVLALLMSCLLVVAPLLPTRADAGQTITICADGVARQVVVDADGNPIPPCLLGDHCANCVILSVPAPVEAVTLARPLWTASLIVPVPSPIRTSLARLPVPSARAPPAKVF